MQIHLFIDSPFYTHRIIEKLGHFEPANKLFVTIKSHKEVKLMENGQETTMTIPRLNAFLKTREFTSVYAHFLSNSIAYVLFKSQLIKLPCYWILWGADFYGLPTFSDQYYLPKSRPFAWKNNTWKHKLAKFLGMPSSDYVMKAVKEINYYVGFEEEFLLTQKALNHSMEFVPWQYYFSIEEMGAPAINQGTGAILLGNSDDPMNNHLDILDKLEKVITPGQRIIIPLHGAKKSYIEKLKEASKNSKAEIVIQEKALDKSSFFKMLDEVSFVVYGHLRQQGEGTLFPLMYAGKKVFMLNQNPLKAILERWGLQVTSINQFAETDFIKFTEEQVHTQRRNLQRVLSSEVNAASWNTILGG